MMLPLMIAMSIALISCGQTEPAIDFGKAECAHCRMNVVDKQFGAALTTVKGRQYVFDDISCMVQFVKAGTVAEDQVAGWYVCDHARPGKLIEAKAAFYAHGDQFRSPMRGDIAAFGTEEQRVAAIATNGEPLDWEGVRQMLVR